MLIQIYEVTTPEEAKARPWGALVLLHLASASCPPLSHGRRLSASFLSQRNGPFACPEIINRVGVHMYSSKSPLNNVPRKFDLKRLLSAVEGISPGTANGVRESATYSSSTVEPSTFGPEFRLLEPTTRAASEPVHHASERPTTGRRIRRVLARYCIAVLAGVGATLAWQSHADELKWMIVSSVPSLGWLISAAPSTPAIAQQLGPVMLEVADVRQRIEALSTNQEQLAQTLAALRAAMQDNSQKALSHTHPLAMALPLPEQSGSARASAALPPTPLARSASPPR